MSEITRVIWAAVLALLAASIAPWRWRFITAPFLHLYYPSHGWCGRCRWSWPVAQEHETLWGQGSYRGLFAVCQKCWEELGDPEARLPFYRAAWERYWANEPWGQIEAAVRREGAFTQAELDTKIQEARSRFCEVQGSELEEIQLACGEHTGAADLPSACRCREIQAKRAERDTILAPHLNLTVLDYVASRVARCANCRAALTAALDAAPEGE
jgi:hypothetical protein